MAYKVNGTEGLDANMGQEVMSTKENKIVLKWKQIRSKIGPKPRSIMYYETRLERGGLRLTFRIAPYGGFCTVKRYWLSVYNPTVIERAEGFDDVSRPPLVSVVFYKLGDAKTWVEQFLTDGATITPIQLLPVYS